MVPDLSFSDELKDMAVKTVLDGIPFLVGIGEFTHFRTYFSGWIG